MVVWQMIIKKQGGLFCIKYQAPYKASYIFIINIIHIMAINLRKLLSLSAQLSLQACQIVFKSLSNHSYKEYMKGEDDPVTDADFKIQSMLIKGFKMNFPDLRIVGEQSEQYQGQIDFDYNALQSDALPSTSKIDQNLKIQQTCVWIDPIDCTRGFLNGNFEDVTVLIGVSNKNKPVAGIIGTPYKQINDKKLYDPIVTVGSVKQLEAYDFNGKIWTKKVKKAIHQPLRITTSNSRRTKAEEKFLASLKAIDVRAGGSGRKIMMVANGQADAMIYCDSWTHKWDSCAGDAIIRSMGGYFATPFGQPITYNPDIGTTHNKQGMVAAMDRQIYQKCMDALAVF